jgi:intracellular sulfur oxidation DsrE/DsrF family protein
MMKSQHISDELLNSFIDGELAPNETGEMFITIGRDDALKERVCELRGLKEMVMHAYHLPPVNGISPSKRPGTWQIPRFQYLPKMATCMLMLLLGLGSGWVIFAGSHSMGDPKLMRLLETAQGNRIIAKSGNIIVHVSNSNPVRLKSALDETENLLSSYKRANRHVNVEIIANGSGLDLLRSDVSPFAKRIAMMKAKYPNLDLLACQQTIKKLQKQGINVKLLPHTGSTHSAVEEIDKRLHQGWDYVRV